MSGVTLLLPLFLHGVLLGQFYVYAYFTFMYWLTENLIYVTNTGLGLLPRSKPLWCRAGRKVDSRFKSCLGRGLHVLYLGEFENCEKLRHVHLSAKNNSALTGRIFVKSDIWVFHENPSRKIKFHENLTRVMGTLHEDQHTFLIISY